MYHVHRPNYSYLEDGNEKLYMRMSDSSMRILELQIHVVQYYLGFITNVKKTAQEIFYGAYYKYQLTEGSKVTSFSKPMSMSFGLFHRFKDALVGKFMFEYDMIAAEFAYDINLSSLTEVSRSRGGFELFLRFNMPDSQGMSRSRI